MNIGSQDKFVKVLLKSEAQRCFGTGSPLLLRDTSLLLLLFIVFQKRLGSVLSKDGSVEWKKVNFVVFSASEYAEEAALYTAHLSGLGDFSHYETACFFVR